MSSPSSQKRTRLYRVGDQIQMELAYLIDREIKDPRLGVVTITEVEVSNDLSHAQVFVAFREDNEKLIKESLQVLHHASGFLRRRLGKAMNIRHIPELHFHHDNSQQRGEKIDALLRDI